jgi:dienelactone hydrolase
MHNLKSMAALFFAMSAAAATVSVPETKVDLSAGKQLVTVTSWRICGPYKLPEADQVYTQAGVARAFSHDYLASIGGTESPFRIGAPTTLRLTDFTHDPTDEKAVKTGPIPKYDQVVEFPVPAVNSYVLFRRVAEYYKIMYAAADIVSPEDADVVLLMGSNSPMKLWLNDKVLTTSRASSIGHDSDVFAIVPVHLKKGSNTVLVKFFCFPNRNEFCLRFGTEKSVREFVTGHGGLRDLVEQTVVPVGNPLVLSENLRFFGASTAEFLQAGKVVKELPFANELPTTGLSEGLYTLRVGDFTEDIYLGVADDIYKTYQARCDKLGATERLAPCDALAGLKEITIPTGPKFSFRLDWQKRALFYVAQLEWNLRNAQAKELPLNEQIGTHLVAYRSPIDGQVQYYILHLPRNYDGSHPIPLVIHCPHNTREKPFMTGATVFDVDWIRKLAQFSDDQGVACLWPHARGRYYHVPIAFADVMEVLSAVEKDHHIDPRRIYLTGDCEGAAFAMGLAESYPDRFAALGLMNTITGGRFPTPYWRMANDLTLRAENLNNIPLQLLHGRLFPHSPSMQSLRFAEAAKAKGLDPKLVLVEGDARWDDNDPFRLSFDFFRGKATPEAPAKVNFVTARLKQDTAYWVRVKSLIDSTRAGSVRAQFEPPNEISATTENVSELELLPGRLGAIGKLAVTVNGEERPVQLDGANPISIPLQAPEAAKGLRKTHEIEGPVADAFTGPFLLIDNTLGDEAERKRENKLVDNLAQGWQETLYVPCRRKHDADVTDADLQDYNLVLVGTKATNSLLKRMADELPLAIETKSIRIGETTYEGPSLGTTFVYPNPLNPQRYVVVMTSNNFTDFAMPARNLAIGGWFDIAVWNSVQGHPDLIWAGYWNKNWQLPKAAPEMRGSGPQN